VASVDFQSRNLARLYRRLIAAVGVIVYALPFLVSLSLPYAYWDWLMAYHYQLRGKAFLWSDLPANIWFVFFKDPVEFRPLSAIALNLQYLIFKGEFWLWYVTKWALLAACVGLIFAAVRRLTGSALAAFVAGLYFALHPMPLVLDVISQDVYVVVFGAAGLVWLGSRPDPIDVMPWSRFLVLLLFCTLSALSKEIGIVYPLAVLAFLIVQRGVGHISFNTVVRSASVLGLVAVCLVRLASIQYPSSRAGQMFSIEGLKLFIDAQVSSAGATCGFLLPQSAMQSLTILVAAIMVSGAVSILLWRRSLLPLMAFSLCGFAGSLFVIGTIGPCTKYLPVPVFFFAIGLGAAIAALEGVRSFAATTAASVFAILLVLSSPPKIYGQWLGMMQSLYEVPDLTHFMEGKAREGYALRWNRDNHYSELPWEKGRSIEEFFEASSVNWYGYREPVSFRTLQELGVPQGKFVLLSSYSPAQVAAGALKAAGINDLSAVTAIYQFERERFGTFERVTASLKRMDRRLGIDLTDPIACQPPHPSRFHAGWPNPTHALGHSPTHSGPHLLYVFDRASPGGVQDVTMLPSLRRYGAFAR
jgi:hypothetical protein